MRFILNLLLLALSDTLRWIALRYLLWVINLRRIYNVLNPLLLSEVRGYASRAGYRTRRFTRYSSTRSAIEPVQAVLCVFSYVLDLVKLTLSMAVPDFIDDRAKTV
jgi:hypothetical protein